MNYTKLIVSVLVILAIAGGYIYPKYSASFGSSTGATFGDAKVAAIVMTPASASATSSSILNTDASDRFITDAFVVCSAVGNVFTAVTGAGLTSAGWLWKAATSSTASPANIQGFTSADLAMSVSVATTTAADAYTATSTFTQVYNQRWKTNTYMTFQPNATSSTAVCTVGVHYLGT